MTYRSIDLSFSPVSMQQVFMQFKESTTFFYYYFFIFLLYYLLLRRMLKDKIIISREHHKKETVFVGWLCPHIYTKMTFILWMILNFFMKYKHVVFYVCVLKNDCVLMERPVICAYITQCVSVRKKKI